MCLLLEDVAGKLQFPTSGAAAAAAATAIALGQPQLGLMVCTLLLTNLVVFILFNVNARVIVLIKLITKASSDIVTVLCYIHCIFLSSMH